MRKRKRGRGVKTRDKERFGKCNIWNDSVIEVKRRGDCQFKKPSAKFNLKIVKHRDRITKMHNCNKEITLSWKIALKYERRTKKPN